MPPRPAPSSGAAIPLPAPAGTPGPAARPAPTADATATATATVTAYAAPAARNSRRWLPGGRARPVVGAEPLPVGAQFLDATYQGAAGRLRYKLYIPAARRDAAAPLLIMLHGCTQSPDDFAAGTRMNALAEAHGCLVA